MERGISRCSRPGAKGGLITIEQAIANAGSNQGDVEDELARVERMVPALQRPGGTRRGEVVLSQDEAWELMVTTGSLLVAAGFDVRVPALSRRKPTPSLRVFADAASDTVVGANQLVNVRWTALFDDVELTAADIARLAKEARPLLRSRGRWIAVDQADLQAAAAALAEQGKATQLSGAEMLRLALGLEGSPLAGGISIEGGGWAADLLAAASAVSGEPAAAPAGFVGELRSYQAEALAWLGLPRHRRPRRLPRPRHGPRQDAHDAGAPARGRGQGPGTRDRARGRRRELGRRGRALHTRPARRRAPRHQPRRGRRDRRPRSPMPTS